MKAGILGTGSVGQVLSKAFLLEGYEVMIGSRDPQKKEVQDFISINSSVKAGTFSETAAFGDLLVLAVKGAIAEKVLKMCDEKDLKSKVIIDATNPIAATPPTNGVLHFTTTLESSLMEQLQQAFPEARFVKAFNSVGNAAMYKPSFKEQPTMFICGNDDEAKKTVSGILTNFGWESEDMGKAEAARAIEPLCILWCIPGFLSNQWTHAFKLLKQ